MKYGTQTRTLDCLLMNPPDDFSRYPYLGLCLLAAVLRERGLRVEILDCAALGYGAKEAVEYVAKKRPRVIGISAMSMMLRFCYALVRQIQGASPDSVLVMGGAHVNADPDIILPMGVKYGFRGECENHFADFCECILQGKKPEPLPGLIVCESGSIHSQPPAITQDLDRLPLMAYDLLPLDRYYSPSTSLRTISYISSRGCPFNCAYCSKLQRVKYRCIGIETVLEHLDILVNKYNIRWIEFVDEIFTLRRDRTEQLCEGILKRGLHFEWGIGTRADCIDKGLVQLMREAGCRKIGFGIESGVERVRYLENKRISNEQIREAIDICRKHRIMSMGSFILGHPTETVDEMLETVRFSKSLPLSFTYFHRMIPIPGSELFEQAKIEGLIQPDAWTKFMLGKCPHPLYKPKGISEAAMKRMYTRAWLSSYMSPRALWRNRSLLLSSSHLLRSVRAFVKLASTERYQK